MELLAFITTVVLVTASGALAPGPLFFAAVSNGARSGAKGGLAMSVGHTLVELPLVFALAIGLLSVANEPVVRLFTGVAGGLALIFFGFLQVRDAALSAYVGSNPEGRTVYRDPLLIGLVFTGLNPFFIVWWLTIGGKLITDALTFAALTGVAVMYFSHVWMDYAWLITISHLARVGMNFLSGRVYRILAAFFGFVLVCFGVSFLLSVV